eukprot:gnl/Chilomastix_cuspidata/1252.p1 GENE.gnl/Chilomastix_cuspidata/1252~~gnl/Chilomastix_cuspidata/1252.p1  ORF type:complete len:2147 (+),score=672.93 gnl/Chilomastix_cuspidata/1252:2922-9362(+)
MLNYTEFVDQVKLVLRIWWEKISQIVEKEDNSLLPSIVALNPQISDVLKRLKRLNDMDKPNEQLIEKILDILNEGRCILKLPIRPWLSSGDVANPYSHSFLVLLRMFKAREFADRLALNPELIQKDNLLESRWDWLGQIQRRGSINLIALGRVHGAMSKTQTSSQRITMVSPLEPSLKNTLTEFFPTNDGMRVKMIEFKPLPSYGTSHLAVRFKPFDLLPPDAFIEYNIFHSQSTIPLAEPVSFRAPRGQASLVIFMGLTNSFFQNTQIPKDKFNPRFLLTITPVFLFVRLTVPSKRLVAGCVVPLPAEIVGGMVNKTNKNKGMSIFKPDHALLHLYDLFDSELQSSPTGHNLLRKLQDEKMFLAPLTLERVCGIVGPDATDPVILPLDLTAWEGFSEVQAFAQAKAVTRSGPVPWSRTLISTVPVIGRFLASLGPEANPPIKAAQPLLFPAMPIPGQLREDLYLSIESLALPKQLKNDKLELHFLVLTCYGDVIPCLVSADEGGSPWIAEIWRGDVKLSSKVVLRPPDHGLSRETDFTFRVDMNSAIRYLRGNSGMSAPKLSNESLIHQYDIHLLMFVNRTHKKRTTPIAFSFARMSPGQNQITEDCCNAFSFFRIPEYFAPILLAASPASRVDTFYMKQTSPSQLAPIQDFSLNVMFRLLSTSTTFHKVLKDFLTDAFTLSPAPLQAEMSPPRGEERAPDSDRSSTDAVVVRCSFERNALFQNPHVLEHISKISIGSRSSVSFTPNEDVHFVSALKFNETSSSFTEEKLGMIPQHNILGLMEYIIAAITVMVEKDAAKAPFDNRVPIPPVGLRRKGQPTIDSLTTDMKAQKNLASFARWAETMDADIELPAVSANVLFSLVLFLKTTVSSRVNDENVISDYIIPHIFSPALCFPLLRFVHRQLDSINDPNCRVRSIMETVRMLPFLFELIATSWKQRKHHHSITTNPATEKEFSDGLKCMRAWFESEERVQSESVYQEFVFYSFHLLLESVLQKIYQLMEKTDFEWLIGVKTIATRTFSVLFEHLQQIIPTYMLGPVGLKLISSISLTNNQESLIDEKLHFMLELVRSHAFSDPQSRALLIDSITGELHRMISNKIHSKFLLQSSTVLADLLIRVQHVPATVTERFTRQQSVVFGSLINALLPIVLDELWHMDVTEAIDKRTGCVGAVDLIFCVLTLLQILDPDAILAAIAPAEALSDRLKELGDFLNVAFNLIFPSEFFPAQWEHLRVSQLSCGFKLFDIALNEIEKAMPQVRGTTRFEEKLYTNFSYLVGSFTRCVLCIIPLGLLQAERLPPMRRQLFFQDFGDIRRTALEFLLRLQETIGGSVVLLIPWCIRPLLEIYSLLPADASAPNGANASAKGSVSEQPLLRGQLMSFFHFLMEAEAAINGRLVAFELSILDAVESHVNASKVQFFLNFIERQTAFFPGGKLSEPLDGGGETIIANFLKTTRSLLSLFTRLRQAPATEAKCLIFQELLSSLRMRNRGHLFIKYANQFSELCVELGFTMEAAAVLLQMASETPWKSEVGTKGSALQSLTGRMRFDPLEGPERAFWRAPFSREITRVLRATSISKQEQPAQYEREEILKRALEMFRDNGGFETALQISKILKEREMSVNFNGQAAQMNLFQEGNLILRICDEDRVFSNYYGCFIYGRPIEECRAAASRVSLSLDRDSSTPTSARFSSPLSIPVRPSSLEFEHPSVFLAYDVPLFVVRRDPSCRVGEFTEELRRSLPGAKINTSKQFAFRECATKEREVIHVQVLTLAPAFFADIFEQIRFNPATRVTDEFIKRAPLPLQNREDSKYSLFVRRMVAAQTQSVSHPYLIEDPGDSLNAPCFAGIAALDDKRCVDPGLMSLGQRHPRHLFARPPRTLDFLEEPVAGQLWLEWALRRPAQRLNLDAGDAYLSVFEVTGGFAETAPERVSEGLRNRSCRIFSFQHTSEARTGVAEIDANLHAILYQTHTFLITRECFPGLVRQSPVTEVVQFTLTPPETATRVVRGSERRVALKTQQFEKSPDRNCEELTGLLNGSIQAAVNGGISLYMEAFLARAFLRHAPNRALIGHIFTLIDTMVRFFETMRRSLHVHMSLTDNIPLQNEIESLYGKLLLNFVERVRSFMKFPEVQAATARWPGYQAALLFCRNASAPGNK